MTIAKGSLYKHIGNKKNGIGREALTIFIRYCAECSS